MRAEHLKRGAYAIAGIALFILSIELLKTSTNSVLPLLKNFIGFINSPSKALGAGWIFSYLIFSGSPVAALSLSFLDAGLLTAPSSFAMIIGSRLGASFILIVIGVVEYLRGEGELMDTTSIGFLSFLITYTICIPALFLGLILLRLDLVSFQFNLSFVSAIAELYSPAVNFILSNTGPLLSFIFSLVLLYISLSVFEQSFRKIKVERARSSWINFLMERPYFSFLFGALVTMLGQSVSLSIGVMVPLYLKGFIERRNLIPYIMGANVTTFTDTLAVGFLLGNATAVNITSIALLGNLVISGVILLFYHRYYDFVRRTMNYLLFERRALILFLSFLLIFPIFLLFA